MGKKTKPELEQELQDTKNALEKEQQRMMYHIEGCNISTSDPDPVKMAIANAVAEGMKALQKAGGNSYGIYIDSTQSGVDE